MPGLYHPSGAYNVSIVSGDEYVGTYAPDGSLNVAVADTTTSSHAPYLGNKYYSPAPFTSGVAAAVPAVDTIYLVPFYLSRSITITNGSLRVNTGGAGSSF